MEQPLGEFKYKFEDIASAVVRVYEIQGGEVREETSRHLFLQLTPVIRNAFKLVRNSDKEGFGEHQATGNKGAVFNSKQLTMIFTKLEETVARWGMSTYTRHLLENFGFEPDGNTFRIANCIMRDEPYD